MVPHLDTCKGWCLETTLWGRDTQAKVWSRRGWLCEDPGHCFSNFGLQKNHHQGPGSLKVIGPEPLCFIKLPSAAHFSSVAQSCPTLCDPMNHSTPGLPVYHQLLEFTQTHIYWVSDAIQPSHPLSSPSPPAPNPSHHQSLFQWVNSSHEVAKVLEFQL